MTNRRNPMAVALAAVLAAAGVAAAANFPTGTHLVKGTLKDWQNKVLSASAEVTVQAVDTNGTVIASAKVADPNEDGYNFLLQIPLSSAATGSTAAVGDTLNCVLVRKSGLSLAVEPIVVGEANTVSTLRFALVDMKSYASEDGETTVNVPSEYVDGIAPWMEFNGIGGDYDPFADYDGDGASNYAEYLAGTNPFDASDKLAITGYDAARDDLHEIRFEYVGGHVYGVATTFSLVNPEWAAQPARKSESDAEHEQVMPSADEEDVGETAVYVVPAEGATSQFFRVEAK